MGLLMGVFLGVSDTALVVTAGAFYRRNLALLLTTNSLVLFSYVTVAFVRTICSAFSISIT